MNLTWQAIVVLLGIVAAIVIMFGMTNDETTRKQLLGYLDTIVPFLFGGVFGAAITSAKMRSTKQRRHGAPFSGGAQ